MHLHKKYFKLAENISELSDFKRVHIGSVLVKNKDVVSVGQNMLKTHPAQHRYNKCLPYDMPTDHVHSEINCISKARPDLLRGSTLYIFRRDRNGNPAMCRPCNACMQAIRDAGIRDIYYSTGYGYSYERIS